MASQYDITKSRTWQWIIILLILFGMTGAYWYFQTRAAVTLNKSGVSGTTINASQNTSLTNGLVGQWSFDGKDTAWTSSAAGTIADTSGSGNTGTLTNMSQTTSPVPGKIGQALSFWPGGVDTNAYVAVGDPVSGALDFGSGDFSVGLWLKGNGYVSQGSAGNFALSKRSNDTAGCLGYALAYDSSNRMQFGIGNGTTCFIVTASHSTVSDNQWHHYVGLRSGNDIYLFVDGVLNSTTTVSGSVSSSYLFHVGSDSNPDRNTNALIDDVRVYNRALSVTEIANLYDLGQSDKVNSSISQSQGTGRLDSGLAGYWKMDDNTGTSATDSSTNGNTGTLTNGPTWTTGQIGGGLNFAAASNQYINAGNNTSLKFTNGPYTLSAWVKLNSIPTNGTNTVVITKLGTSNDYYYFGISHNNSVIAPFWRPGSGASMHLGTGAMVTDQWYHIVVTFNKPDYVMYINGAMNISGTDTVPGGFVNGDGNFYIGSNAGIGFFDGSIDEVRVYNRTLSADEVSELYRLTAPTGTDTSLKGYWSFNGQDMNGTTAYDRSGAGNNGTLTNGPTPTIGKIGQALSINSSKYVLINSAPTPASASYGAWVDNTSSGVDTSCFMGYCGSSSVVQNIHLCIKDAGAYSSNFGVYAFVGNGSQTLTAFHNIHPYPKNSWHHIFATYDAPSGLLNLYFDGNMVSSTSGTAGLGISYGTYGSDVYLGGCTARATLPANIDEARVYDRALSASEVTTLYNASR
ncbi:MAG: LamG domain-containing protein [Candidatus Moranbacteria bacterium]|nr:LamG domain-containing protein [Candidatus Moranbacteria bacterium]MDD3965413.1 LamG domain-containing protein [Candidatus Moranbacteria bacterium]